MVAVKPLAVFLVLLFGEQSTGVYEPGTPGAVWSKEEVDIVRKKVREILTISNWRGEDAWDLSETGTLSSTENKWCKDCYWNYQDTSKSQVPMPAKVLRLAFHDCVPYISEDGHVTGGCDGCLNWKNIGFGFSGFPHGCENGNCKQDYFAKDFKRGDNNGLQTVVAALELVYTVPNWPPTAPDLDQSLRDSGKSRADLWQFAANVALEMEIEKANFACDYDYNTGNQARLLEGKDKCYFKLFKPAVFKFGRRDCIPDETKKPYETAQVENHPNVYGSAKQVVDNLRSDFNLTAREGISLLATHATAGQQHNFRYPVKYMWAGNPYLTNMYFKYIAGTDMFRRGSNGLSPSAHTSVGDWSGKPNMGHVWSVKCFKIWKSNMTDNGWGGPCFWRPNYGGCNRPGEERSKGCFDHFTEDGSIVVKTGWKDPNNMCRNIAFDENRIQSYTDEQESTVGKQSCNHELSFGMTFEINLRYEFQLDEEFRPYGCQGDLGENWWDFSKPTVNCPPNMERYENGEALSEIVTAFGEDHDVWNQEFMKGWAKFTENGYKGDDLVTGPEYSWLGSSYIDSFETVSFPLVFTDSKKYNPSINFFRQAEDETHRGRCVKSPETCPPEFRKDHQDYYLGRLESPWGCDEKGSTLTTIPIQIINNRDGRVLQMNTETGVIEIGVQSGKDTQEWTFAPSCTGESILTNIGTSTSISLDFDHENGTLMDENGLLAKSQKKEGLVWMEEDLFNAAGNNQRLRFQWTVIRA